VSREIRKDRDGALGKTETLRLGVVAIRGQRCIADEIHDVRMLGQRRSRSRDLSGVVFHRSHAREAEGRRTSAGKRQGAA